MAEKNSPKNCVINKAINFYDYHGECVRISFLEVFKGRFNSFWLSFLLLLSSFSPHLSISKFFTIFEENLLQKTLRRRLFTFDSKTKKETIDSRAKSLFPFHPKKIHKISIMTLLKNSTEGNFYYIRKIFLAFFSYWTTCTSIFPPWFVVALIAIFDIFWSKGKNTKNNNTIINIFFRKLDHAQFSQIVKHNLSTLLLLFLPFS